MKKVTALLLSVAVVASMAACGQSDDKEKDDNKVTPTPTQEANNDADDVDGELILDHEEELQFAKMLSITRYKGGYVMFDTHILEDVKYLVVPEGKSVPKDLEEGVVVMQQPMNNFRFSSTSMVSLVDAIGGLDNITSVSTDKGSWYLDNVIERMESGKIKFSGKYSEPDYEMLVSDGVQVNIDTTMLTYKPEVMEKYDELGIIYVIEASSREEHPLGRVEWVKLWGILMGMEEEAYTFFEEQVSEFDKITALDSLGVTALSFYPSDENVNVHYDNSFYGATTVYAGAEYPLKDTDPEDTTSYEKMGIEDFYEFAKDTDFLFSIANTQLFTMQDLIDYNAVFADCKAVQDGNVYVFKSSFIQSAGDVVTAISEIRQVMQDPTIEETSTLYKLK